MNHKSYLKGFLVISSILVLVSLSIYSVSYSGGPPASHTNAPNENNCTACHTGTLVTSGTNWDNIKLSGNLHQGGYIPDSTYTLTLKYKHKGISTFGFELTCLDDKDVKAGALDKVDSRTSRITATVSSKTREYIRHTSLGNSGNDSISWDFKWTAPSSNIDSVIYYVAVNSANGDNGTKGDMILAKEIKIGPSPLLPDATIEADTNIICSGTSLQFYGSSNDSNAKYLWSFPTGNPSTSTSQNPLVRFNSSGNRTVSLETTNKYGKSLKTTYVITIRSTPVASLLTTDQLICEGDSAEIRATFDPTAKYTWNNGGSSNVIYVQDTGYYYVTVSKGGCVAVSDSVHVGYYPKPEANLFSSALNDSLCVNSDLKVYSTATADSFMFYENGQLSAIIDSGTLNTVLKNTTTFGLSIKDSNGCISEKVDLDVVVVEHLPAPVVSCSNSSTSSVEFSWSDANYTNGFEISLDAGLTWTDPSSGKNGTTHLESSLKPGEEVELWVRALDAPYCDYSEVAQLVCKADTCESLPYTVSYTQKVCSGDTVFIELSNMPLNYWVYFGDGPAFQDSSFYFIPLVNKAYNMVVEDSNELICGTANFVINPTVVPYVDPIVTLSKDSLCEGEQLNISVNDSFDQVDFYISDTLFTSGGQNTLTLIPSIGTDSVYARVSNSGCEDVSPVAHFYTSETPDPGFTFVVSGNSVLLTPIVTVYDSYSWSTSDGQTSTDKAPAFTTSSDTITVSLTVVTLDGCSADTSILVKIVSSLDDLSVVGLRVYPNPTNDILKLENNSAIEHIEILDQNGRVVRSIQLNGINQQIDLTDLVQGVYTLRVKKDDLHYYGKILKL